MLRALFLLICIQLLSIIPSLSAPAVALVVEDDTAPYGYDFIGVYHVESVIRVREGESFSSPIVDTSYRVFSNGSEIRLYQVNAGNAYHTYNVYRSDGISEQSTGGAIMLKPGLQARQVSSDLVKQLSLTQRSLTITQFPAISDTVVVTYAKRVAKVK